WTTAPSSAGGRTAPGSSVWATPPIGVTGRERWATPYPPCRSARATPPPRSPSVVATVVPDWTTPPSSAGGTTSEGGWVWVTARTVVMGPGRWATPCPPCSSAPVAPPPRSPLVATLVPD